MLAEKGVSSRLGKKEVMTARKKGTADVTRQGTKIDGPDKLVE